MVINLTPEMVAKIESLLRHGSRVEVLIEQGKITIVEIRRKMRIRMQNLLQKTATLKAEDRTRKYRRKRMKRMRILKP